MTDELMAIVITLKRLRQQADENGELGIVGYLNSAIDDLTECAETYPKHVLSRRD